MTKPIDYQRAYEIQKAARQQAETLLEHKSRELYEKNQSLQAAMSELKAKQEQIIAQEKMASIGQLSAGLAHEINNPNAFIQSNLGTLKSYLSNLIMALQSATNRLDPDTVAKLASDYDLEYIMADADALLRETLYGTERIEHIITGLRYFTQPKLHQRVHFDVNKSVHSAVNHIRAEAPASLIFHEQYGDLPQINGIPQLFEQAITNLLKNAQEATDGDSHIRISTEANDHTIDIQIEDEGIGILADCEQKVFEPFYTTKPDANGMGLPIAHAIVRQHDGQLRLCRQPQGTRVTITLPLQAQ